MGYTNAPPREPEQPGEKDWGFVALLKEPLHQPFRWKREEARPGEISLKDGIRLVKNFPDTEGLLDTSFEDFQKFLKAGGIKLAGNLPVIIKKKKTGVFEEYVISVKKGGVEVAAGDTEGIRRALVYLEDELMRSGGPFLEAGRIKRTPVIKTRISRCCYGPINRPPKNRDELNDDIDYYPEEYLNRLAHHAVNGLWLTITFRDTVPSKIIPEYGQNAEKRIEKLRQIVKKCRRYGIKVYPFCIEPVAFPAGSPMIKKYPELQGHNNNAYSYFCTSTKKGKAYIEEAAYTLFKRVPHLGGLINISVGERPTNCYSGSITDNNCPRCSRRKPSDVIAGMLSSMARGMHKANPSAQLISWHYSQYICWGEEATKMAAGEMPKNIALQFNFESAGRAKQLGKTRYAGDYWLSYVGPSRLFMECCRNAAGAGTPVFAKIQVSCSHEVATVPWVSVPGNLYRKYRAMHQLGVSGVMECWFFGAYPGLMTKAAGELAFAPFPKSESAFLKHLAGCWWPGNKTAAAKAWEYYRRAYSSYPMNALFGYYGPMHDGPAWPLYLRPRNKPLAPTWRINYPPSGDRIGQSFTYTHTMPEMLRLCKDMAEGWNRGVETLKKDAEKRCPETEEKLRVDEALGLQFESGYRILRFYDLREKLFEMKGNGRMKVLGEMKNLLLSEIEASRKLYKLAREDPRLGFHAEAEGYKYFPEKLLWRIKWLENVLKKDFPLVEREIKKGNALFPGYTGEKPDTPVYECMALPGPPAKKGLDRAWDKIREEPMPFWFYFDREKAAFERETANFSDTRKTTWKAARDKDNLYFTVRCQTPDMKGLKIKDSEDFVCKESVELQVEPKRLFPRCSFTVDSSGKTSSGKMTHGDYAKKRSRWKASVHRGGGEWIAFFRIPLGCIPYRAGKYRFNVIRWVQYREEERGNFRSYMNRWMDYKALEKSLLAFGKEDPAFNFGWILTD